MSKALSSFLKTFIQAIADLQHHWGIWGYSNTASDIILNECFEATNNLCKFPIGNLKVYCPMTNKTNITAVLDGS